MNPSHDPSFQNLVKALKKENNLTTEQALRTAVDLRNLKSLIETFKLIPYSEFSEVAHFFDDIYKRDPVTTIAVFSLIGLSTQKVVPNILDNNRQRVYEEVKKMIDEGPDVTAFYTEPVEDQ